MAMIDPSAERATAEPDKSPSDSPSMSFPTLVHASGVAGTGATEGRGLLSLGLGLIAVGLGLVLLGDELGIMEGNDVVFFLDFLPLFFIVGLELGAELGAALGYDVLSAFSFLDVVGIELGGELGDAVGTGVFLLLFNLLEVWGLPPLWFL